MSKNASVRKKNVYSSRFKLERALEAISSDNISETARKYNISTNLLCLWKRQLLERGSSVFDSSPDKSVNQLKAKVSRLEQMIGKKEIELNLLKNFSDFYSSPRDT
jgi:transposase